MYDQAEPLDAPESETEEVLGPIELSRLLELARWLDPQISSDAEHSSRVSRIAHDLATAAGLDGFLVAQATLAGLLHDIGKVVVPRSVLLKPAALNSAEFDWIKLHPQASGRLADRANLGTIASTLRHHHERWDGSGYPQGLAGELIPLVARVISIADAFDAMIADRPYRNSMTVAEAYRELEQGAGSQFDPDLVAVFLQHDLGNPQLDAPAGVADAA